MIGDRDCELLKGPRCANPVPNKFHWSNRFSSTSARFYGCLRTQVTRNSRAKNISLVQWFLIDPCSLMHISHT